MITKPSNDALEAQIDIFSSGYQDAVCDLLKGLTFLELITAIYHSDRETLPAGDTVSTDVVADIAWNGVQRVGRDWLRARAANALHFSVHPTTGVDFWPDDDRYEDATRLALASPFGHARPDANEPVFHEPPAPVAEPQSTDTTPPGKWGEPGYKEWLDTQLERLQAGEVTSISLGSTGRVPWKAGEEGYVCACQGTPASSDFLPGLTGGTVTQE
ncbi:hypothetical protein [Haloglycomyces albus]|uniref:hypothetical protein n=1 Tax=Haloglycomyces albus TaxID=526067 RepID=UPI00046D289A|nr:hypothetical protein [Haloglycomyces albus]